MKRTFSLPLMLMLISAFPAFSQDNEFEILTGIISAFSVGNIVQPDVATQSITGALDIPAASSAPQPNAEASGSPLDFVTATTDNEDPFSALVGLFAQPQGKGAGLGVLDVISNAYDSNGFYMSGVLESMDFSTPEYQAPVIPTMSGMTFYHPEWGSITSGFGYREQYKRVHKGIDVAMNMGDTVRAALPGIVESVAYEDKGYGHYIILKHDNGMETRYAHLSMSIAGAGERVVAGQPIALSGNSGNCTGPHLHFETRYNGEAVNPEMVFNLYGNQPTNYFDFQSATPSKDYTMATGFNGSKKSLTGKSTYVVREGDTLSKIASRAGISVLRLCQLNFITESQTIYPGTMLKLK